MSEFKCKQCRHFRPGLDADSTGTCRRNPPALVGTEYGRCQPLTHPDDWCGQFEPTLMTKAEAVDILEAIGVPALTEMEKEKAWLQYHLDKLAYAMEQLVLGIDKHADGRDVWLAIEDGICSGLKVSCAHCDIIEALDRSWYEITSDPMEEPKEPTE